MSNLENTVVAPTVAPSVTLSHVRKVYGGGTLARLFGDEGKVVFRDLSVSFAPGDCVGIMGYSGEGKTTLTRLMMGLTDPTSGTITIDSLPPAHWQQAHPGDFAAVFQDSTSALNPDVTVEDALAGVLRLKGTDPQAYRAQMVETLEALGLSAQILSAYPHELSGGQCQRVAIARALLSQAPITLFDEALSALDAVHQTSVLQHLVRVRPERSLWFFVSHDLEAVVTLCNRILVVGEGGLLADGTPEALLRSENPALRTLIKRCYWD